MEKRTFNKIFEFKIQAKRLLKDFRSDNTDTVRKAVRRYIRLERFKSMSESELLEKKKQVRLKDSLAVLALENGYKSWLHLKKNVEYMERKKSYNNSYLYPANCRVYFNTWYKNYHEAKDYLDRFGGFLLCYAEDFFIADRNYIEALGLSPDDTDWQKIGWDWVHPDDRSAWERLKRKLLEAQN